MPNGLKAREVREVRYGDLTLEIREGVYEPEITEYVAGVYYSRSDYSFDQSFPDVLREMQEEDERLAAATTTYTLKDRSRQIVGTIRTIMKKNAQPLPIEREFDLCLSAQRAGAGAVSGYEPGSGLGPESGAGTRCGSGSGLGPESGTGTGLGSGPGAFPAASRIYEIARFAVTMNSIQGIMILLRAIFDDGKNDDLAVASLDSRVLAGLRRIGLQWYPIQQPKHYLGSLTCPVAITAGHVEGAFAKHAEKLQHKHTYDGRSYVRDAYDRDTNDREAGRSCS